MRTQPFTPAAPAAAAVLQGLDSGAKYDCFDDNGKEVSLSFFSTLYFALCSLRTQLPCSVFQAGEELFHFDGSTSRGTPAFGQALADYEHYLLNERKLGAEQMLEQLEKRLAPPAQDASAEEDQAAPAPAVGDEPTAPSQGAAQRPGEPMGRRQGINRRR